MSITTESLHRVTHFFESYAHALENADTKKMAFHHALPCTFMDDEGCVVFTDASKLEGLFNQGISFFRHHGIANARPEIWSKRQWTGHIIKTKVNWRYYDKDNRFLYTCDYHYLLRFDKHGAWKIQVSTSVNEKERMNEWRTGMRNEG